MIVIYHAGCHDGFCCAWLLHHIYPDAEFMPFQYGMDPPDVTDQDVIVADFSFPLLQMSHMHATAKSLIVFDHHKSVDDRLKDRDWFCFDNNKSGARLVFDRFYADLAGVRNADWLVDYTEDRDLWLWKMPDSREINAGLRLYEFDFEEWNHLDRLSVCNEGITLCDYFDKKAARMAHNHKWIRLGDHVVPAVNCANSDLISLTAGNLAGIDGAPFGVTYFFDGEQFIFSLRSRDGFDVSQVAKDFGGGGHAAAAGFKRRLFFEVLEGPQV